jgi:Transcriptional regulators of sugar metabolism
MLAQQRQQAILERVRRDGGVRVADLVRELGVSDMTIRRDLEVLAERGLVEKVHGGATISGSAATREPGFAAKSVRQQAEKEAIARHAARMVRPGTAIALSAGTTTWALAHHLVDVADLTVITNSVRVADVFHRSGRPDQTVVLTGGVRTPSDALVGPVAVAAIRRLSVHTLFLGVHGMSPRAGFTTRTCWRRRPTASSSPAPSSWWCSPTTPSGARSASARSPIWRRLTRWSATRAWPRRHGPSWRPGWGN